MPDPPSNMMKKYLCAGILPLLAALLAFTVPSNSQVTEKERAIDEKVKKFLDKLSGTDEYYQYMKNLPEFETSIHPHSRAGVAVSCKKKEK